MVLVLLHAIEAFTSLLSIEHGVLGRCCAGKQLLRHAVHLLRLLRAVSCQVSWSLIQEEIRATGVQVPRAHSLCYLLSVVRLTGRWLEQARDRIFLTHRLRGSVERALASGLSYFLKLIFEKWIILKDRNCRRLISSVIFAVDDRRCTAMTKHGLLIHRPNPA